MVAGWTRSERQLRLLWLLEWLRRNEEQNSSIIPHLRDFVEDMRPIEVSDDELHTLITMLKSRRLAEVTETFGGPGDSGARLTPYGTEEVLGMRDRREQPGSRRAACHDALLDWLYDRYNDGEYAPSSADFFRDPRSYCEGQQFCDEDVVDTIVLLREKGLIAGPNTEEAGITHPALTARGVELVRHHRGDTPEYTPREEATSGQNINIYGSSDFALAYRSPGATQAVNSGQVDVGELIRFAELIREATPSLHLDQERVREVEGITEDIRSEAARTTPDEGRLRQLGEKLMSILEGVAASSLAQILMRHAPQWLETLPPA